MQCSLTESVRLTSSARRRRWSARGTLPARSPSAWPPPTSKPSTGDFRAPDGPVARRSAARLPRSARADVPAEADLVGAAATLLQGFRGAGSPVAHVRTIVRADGSDAMPHWRVGERLALRRRLSRGRASAGLGGGGRGARRPQAALPRLRRPSAGPVAARSRRDAGRDRRGLHPRVRAGDGAGRVRARLRGRHRCGRRRQRQPRPRRSHA